MFKNLLLSSLIVLSLVSCDKENEENAVASSNDLSVSLTARNLTTLDNTSWVLQNFTKNPFDSAYENRITLNFGTTENEVLPFSGNSLVNNYFDNFRVETGSGLSSENEVATSTLVGTEDDTAAQIEYDYLVAITEATYFEVENDVLRLYLGDTSNTNTEVLVFNKQ